jgi:MYXO-CTERM domain-containing protein
MRATLRTLILTLVLGLPVAHAETADCPDTGECGDDDDGGRCGCSTGAPVGGLTGLLLGLVLLRRRQTTS